MCMKKFLLIVIAFFLTSTSALAANYKQCTARKNPTVATTSNTCVPCRRERKRFAKPVTRFAQPKPRQKIGYYKTGMNLRYPRTVQKTSIQPSRFNKNYTIGQAKKYTCNGITYYGPNHVCK